MALNLKQLIIQNKIRQLRLAGIKKIIQNVPKKPLWQDQWDDDYDRGVARGRAELASEIRKFIDGAPSDFIPAGRMPGNEANGEKKETSSE